MVRSATIRQEGQLWNKWSVRSTGPFQNLEDGHQLGSQTKIKSKDQSSAWIAGARSQFGLLD